MTFQIGREVETFSEAIELITQFLPLVIPVIALQGILLIAGIVSIVRKNVPQEKTGEKLLWLLVVILVNLIGPIVYFAVGSKRLDELSRGDEDEEE